MTIISERIITSTRASGSSHKDSPKPPPKIYNVQEYPFKGYRPPQPDGYEQSRSSPDSSAIVIDNGMHLRDTSVKRKSYRLISDDWQALIPSKQAGHSINPLDSFYHP